MNTFKKSINTDISKGGLIGALLGSLASTQVHKNSDSMPRKAIKTGFFATIGYFLGTFIEKKITRK